MEKKLMIKVLIIGLCLSTKSYSLFELPKISYTISSVKEGMILTESYYNDGRMEFEITPKRKDGGYTRGIIRPDKTSELQWLEVDEKLRRQGLGSKMFHVVCSEIFNHGCKAIEWEVDPFDGNLEEDGPALVKFYEKRGGVIFGYRPHCYTEGIQFPLMHLTHYEFKKRRNS